MSEACGRGGGPQHVSTGSAVHRPGRRWLLSSPSSRIPPTAPAPGLRAASSVHAQSEGSRPLGAEAPPTRDACF